jgi:hypothetical protein
MSGAWEYLESHDGRRDDKLKGTNAWPMFKNKKSSVQSYQYFGELPPDVYREFDQNRDPIYKNSKGESVNLVGEKYKEPVKYTTLPLPYPLEWSMRKSGSHPGYTTYFNKGESGGQFAAPGVLPEGIKMKFNKTGAIFYQGPPPLNKIYHDDDLKGPPGWRHPIFSSSAGGAAAADEAVRADSARAEFFQRSTATVLPSTTMENRPQGALTAAN